MGSQLQKESAARGEQQGQHAAPAPSPAPTPEHPLLRLQHSAGNHAVGRLIQAKLKVSRPGDRYEQEADRVAEQVMRMPEPVAAQSAIVPKQDRLPHLPRHGSECVEGELHRLTREEDEKEQHLQAKAVMGHSAQSSNAADPHISDTSGNGQPLPASVRAFFEPRFSRDFGHVRVHTDDQATRSAQGVNALAFTVGRDVVFDRGQYTPETVAGRGLLAHELAHVVQQSTPSSPHQGPNLTNPVDARTGPTARQRLNISRLGEASELTATELTDDSVGTRPPGRDVPYLRSADALLQRAPRLKKADAPMPEQTSFDITGHYEVINPTEDTRITIQINQAGRRIVGRWQRRVYSPGAERQFISSSSLDGHLQSDTSAGLTFTYQRFTDKEDAHLESGGTLTAVRDGAEAQILLSGEDGSIALRRTSKIPLVPTEALERIRPERVGELATAFEKAPLDTREEQRISEVAPNIMRMIPKYFDTSDRRARSSLATQVNETVKTLFDHFADEQMPIVTHRLRQILTHITYTVKQVERPLWDWLQIIVVADSAYTEALQKRLDMQKSGVSLSEEGMAWDHHYHWRFAVIGLSADVGIGLGGMIGLFTITKRYPDAWGPVNYRTSLGSVSAGLSAGFQVAQTTENDLSSPFPWTSRNFQGPYVITSVPLGLVSAFGVSWGQGAINFYGDGTFPVLSGDAGGFSEILGLYAGAELSFTAGYIVGEGQQEPVQRTQPYGLVPVDTKLAPKSAIHFGVDEPSLTSYGRDAIREFCALWRSALGNPKNTLSIDGYTSTTGGEKHNQQLSELRAQNTLQAIRDILGPAFAIPEKQSRAVGHGKLPALFKTLRDQWETPTWRKVEVRINGRLVLTLY